MRPCVCRFALVPAVVLSFAANTSPAQTGAERIGSLVTRWAGGVKPDKVLPEYPRPQMVRPAWTNLNGPWDYAIRPRSEAKPTAYDGKILVPFCPESRLSGVHRRVGEANRLWYRRTFQAKRPDDGGRTLLHFGAVDWHSVVWVNGQNVGRHRGGYDPFTIDITDTLDENGANELVVGAWDPTDSASFARGKQKNEPAGIWYTPVTGIWRTVWLEPVPRAYVRRLKIVPDVDAGKVTVIATAGSATADHIVKIVVSDDGAPVASGVGRPGQAIDLKIDDPQLWSPGAPHLYDLRVTLAHRSGNDTVESYFGLRKIAIGRDARGDRRLLLNGKPLFQFGPLDQGWWPDGLYTAPTDAALRYDIEVTKRLGFNMIRKHVKVEPARWYYWCDKLGMLVWQDMPSAMTSARGPQHVSADSEEDFARDAETARQFEDELQAMVDYLHNHPSIVMWVPFNEGWGQYDTRRIATWLKSYDATRLVNATSGWTDRGVGDIYDVHNYPGPAMERDDSGRAFVLGEFGGLGWPVADHLWWNKRNWGYRTYATREVLNAHYRELIDSLPGLIGRGLAAAVYTQTTDVEGEVNGLMTYDRELIKVDEEAARRSAGRLYGPPQRAVELLQPSKDSPQSWRISRRKPSPDWAGGEFSDRSWQTATGPLRAGENPYLPAGTPWRSNQIWARTTFHVERVPRELWMQVYHDVSRLEIYINGRSVRRFDAPRPTRRHYQHMRLGDVGDLLKPGRNVVAIYADKESGARAVDVGLYGLE